MFYPDLVDLINKREKDKMSNANLKDSRLSKAQKETLLDLAEEFLAEYKGEDDFNQRFQLFLLAASKAL